MKFYDMNCPYCGGTDQQADNLFCDEFKPSVYRKINCENCGRTYSVEYVLESVYDDKDCRIYDYNVMTEKDLDTVYLLVASDRDEEAGTFIYQKINAMLCNGKFEEIDKILKSVEILALSMLIMSSFLSVTFAAKDKLPSRSLLHDKIYARMIELKGREKADSLLRGWK